MFAKLSLPSLRWESGVLGMSLRVWVEKILLVRHIRGMEENTLARQIYEEQKSNNWSGLATETKQICHKLVIEDCNESVMLMSKHNYNHMVTDKCREKDEERLKESSEGKEKCDKIMKEEYGRKLI